MPRNRSNCLLAVYVWMGGGAGLLGLCACWYLHFMYASGKHSKSKVKGGSEQMGKKERAGLQGNVKVD